MSHRLDILRGETDCPAQFRGWQARTRQLADQLLARLEKLPAVRSRPAPLVPQAQASAYLLASAYPDRIARRRHSGGYQLANGRSASFHGTPALCRQRWLAVAEVSSMAGGASDIIRSAAALDETLFSSALQALVNEQDRVDWDRKAGRFIAERQRCIGALVLQREALGKIPVEAKRRALIDYLRSEDLQPLPWTAELRQWCARVSLLHALEAQAGWPDVSPQGLRERLDDWLGPWLDPVSSLQGLGKLDLHSILTTQLPWDKQQALQRLAPTRFEVPSGSSIRIDYSASPPVLAVKLQEMFGCEQTPSVADGRVALLVHLLSPAGRPLQITQDLAGFWRSSYHDVKKEMKGRYPKHPWPDDPLLEPATRHTRRRAQQSD